MLFPSISPGVFFRPEEDAFFSKGIDDMGFLQTTEIHVGDKDNRMAIRFLAAAIHGTVNLHPHGTFAVGAFRFDLYDHILLPQPPLHEGRRESVHRSGGIQSALPNRRLFGAGSFQRSPGKPRRPVPARSDTGRSGVPPAHAKFQRYCSLDRARSRATLSAGIGSPTRGSSRTT